MVFIQVEGERKEIKSAVLNSLLQRLVDTTTYDNQFTVAFLLTYRTYTTAKTVLNFLIARFKKTMSVSLQNGARIHGPTHSIQLRICSTLKLWMDRYWKSDFAGNAELQELLDAFVKDVRVTSEKLGNIIGNAVQTLRNGNAAPSIPSTPNGSVENPVPTPIGNRPKAIVPKQLQKKYHSYGTLVPGASSNFINTSSISLNSNSSDATTIGTVGASLLSSVDKLSPTKSFSFVRGTKHVEDISLQLADMDALEVARQITLMEFDFFREIKPLELLQNAWMKEDKEINSPNICKMTKLSNHIIHWVASEIVLVKDGPKQRAVVFEKFVMIAQHLERLRNFNGVKEIIAGLQSSAIHRLKKTKECVSTKHMRIVETLSRIVASDMNYKVLRSRVAEIEAEPTLPFPGVYLSDLVFIEMASKTILDEEKQLINFQKQQKISNYIHDFLRHQLSPYDLDSLPEIQDYVRDYKTLSDEQTYNCSLICEPRV